MDYLWPFILLFAALGASWFYLQRAKARPTTTAPSTEAAANDVTDGAPTA